MSTRPKAKGLSRKKIHALGLVLHHLYKKSAGVVYKDALTSIEGTEITAEEIRSEAGRLTGDRACITMANYLGTVCLYYPEMGSVIANGLRDIFGPLLFRPVTIDASYLSPTVRQLAESIYQERQFDRLPILADALEEAGCTQRDVLKHLRGGGEHVRGCWALDLVTGTE